MKKNDVKLGDYVMVTAPPEQWEGAGESDDDRDSYLGHIGLVTDLGFNDEDCVLVVFPSHDENRPRVQRNIETEILALVSKPARPLTDEVLDAN